MSEVKDPWIKLFGRTIPLPLIPTHPSLSSSSPREVNSVKQHHETEEPSKKELISVKDDDASQHTSEDVKSPATSSGILENPKTPSAETESSLPKSSTNGEQSDDSNSEEQTPKKPEKILPCPRCNSMDTKFCYFNNYNVNQPRHFCKNCQRYWTAGGTMRNVPVGAGRRKNKNASASHYRHLMVPEALQGAKLNSPNGLHNAVLTFDSDSPLCNSMASVLNIAERAQNCVPNGFHANEANSFVSYGREDDHSVGVSVTTSSSSDRRDQSGSNESLNKKRSVEGFPPQLQYIPNSFMPYPWNSSMPPPPPTTFCPPNYPLPFYPTPPPAYWGCMPPPPPSWNISCISPENFVNHCDSTLGKHSRDGSIITHVNSEKEKADNMNSESNVLIPKTLRIDHDSSEAEKSSIWLKLGMNNDKNYSLNGGGMFKAFPSKGKDKSHLVQASPMLYANPAALSRSRNFHETS